MRLDSILDSFYLLNTLWAGMADPAVCTPGPHVRPRVTRAAAWSPAPAAPGTVTAFVDVNVVPMDTERVLAHQTVLVDGRRITALGSVTKVKIPDGAVRIDGRGKYLMPGLGDMHVHNVYADNVDFSERETYDQFVYRMFIRLANGVTTVRYLEDLKSGYLEHFLSDSKTAKLLAPHFYPRVSLRTLKRPDSAAAFVAAAKAGGYGFVNIDPKWAIPSSGKSKPLLDSLLVASQRLHLAVSSHTNTESLDEALAVGTYGGSVEHVEYMFRPIFTRAEETVAAAEIEVLATKVQRAGVWITPTIDCIEQHGGVGPWPGLKITRRVVKALQDAGVGLLLGGDADGPHGQSASIVHEELKEMVRAGLTPYQALVTGTRNVAQYFGLLDSSGTVTVGKRADLVLLHGNPLTNIRHTREPAGVMINGQWLSREELDERLLALPAFWVQVEVGGGFTPRPAESSAVAGHIRRLAILADSLEAAKLREAGPWRQRFTDELGALRATLTPEQREDFDPKARIWLRVQARKGYRTTVAGVTLAP